ncbi:YncE family protein [Mucilaginibacter sp. UR6-1]|uniref:DUF5074 domain-containing protein n=1 Tax=Mucilaginibacter sp. UR6-1 TaxID=1435643 RepID=UPI001E385F41|nr:DUF5074 domain-containing protein [Mucilaginibacter sp. UR6-1]MCC8408047.1 YncE family protein [Mucilaginibacter sp. UR6-1]
MRSFKHSYLLILSALSLFAASCSKDDENPTSTSIGNGVFIVNQGSFNASNASLTFYNTDTKKVIADIFSAVNGSGLGSVANDAAIYGSKMYITVNVSSTLEIINPKDGKLIKHIDMKNGSVNRQPRYVAFYKNKAYITSYDNTVAVLDTASLEIEKFITVGRNPEQMAIANGKLYVANSGGLDFDNPDKTVSVIDLNTNTEIKKIEVPANPVSLAADAGGDIYVISNGNYIDIMPALTIINSATDVVKSSATADVGYGSPIAISGNLAYIISGAGKINVYNTQTDAVIEDNFITGNFKIATPYAIAVKASTNEVFITDAKEYKGDGKLYIFGSNGAVKDSAAVGLFPGKIVFTNN